MQYNLIVSYFEVAHSVHSTDIKRPSVLPTRCSNYVK